MQSVLNIEKAGNNYIARISTKFHTLKREISRYISYFRQSLFFFPMCLIPDIFIHGFICLLKSIIFLDVSNLSPFPLRLYTNTHLILTCVTTKCFPCVSAILTKRKISTTKTTRLRANRSKNLIMSVGSC